MQRILASSNAPYILDIVFVIFIVVMASISAKKGAIKCVVGIVSSITALVCIFLFADKLAFWAKENFSFISSFTNKLQNIFSKIKGFDIDISTGGMEEALNNVSLPSFVKKFLLNNFSDSTKEPGTTLALIAAKGTTDLLTRIVSGIIIFILVKLILWLASIILTKIVEKIPFLGAVNTLLGVVFGILEGFIIVCGLLALIALIPNENFVKFFQSTYLIQYLYNDNPLVAIFMN